MPPSASILPKSSNKCLLGSLENIDKPNTTSDTSSTDCCIAGRITGNPLGPWSNKFTTELGIVTRQFSPQNVPKWSFISPEDKETLIAYLREGFIFSNEPYAIASILGMMKLRYKTYRFNLCQHFRSFPTMESALANPHEDIEKEFIFITVYLHLRVYQFVIRVSQSLWMDPRKSRKSDDDVVVIIQCYNEKMKAFTADKNKLTFTTNDMTLIFGLQGGKGAMSLKYSKKPNTAFLRRRFLKDTRLIDPVLKNALVKYVKPLESMKQYDWSEAIAATLIDSITTLHITSKKVTGCIIALLYWLCEHVNIIDLEDSNTTEFPRCTKWNLQSLTKQLQKTPVYSLVSRQSFLLKIDNKELEKNLSEEFCLGKKKKKESKKALVKFNERLEDSTEEEAGNEEGEGNTEE
ncbi:hypothetical protein TEA_021889 [Camellia sinensis var. sinensis]|uniref:Aminotransferase-like plant mobile domain-containing protein n=1 Tax=Camellia sinensis var. sinensis TaxID=542762 RepID=A0A4S4EEZ4_CAMSN|nr:hypothetical protein TEA_021889 [Camellia sinensis var. sinensis]